MSRHLLVALAFGAGWTAAAQASPLVATVTGSGSYGGNASVIVDGVIPAQGTAYNTPGLTVFWASAPASFTLNYGALDTISSVFLSADNNDTYTVSYSTNGVSYATLFTVLASDGMVGYGLDDFSSDPTSAYYVGRSFAPVQAQYLQVTASAGDGYYGLAELDAYGTVAAPVPEPASIALLGSAFLVFCGVRRRTRSTMRSVVGRFSAQHRRAFA